jgi:uncharacterized coiled-coil DUF342 family protein
LLTVALLLLAAGALAGFWALARRLKARYRELLAAVELVQRQATELRQRVDELRQTAESIERSLADRVEPELRRLGSHLEVAEVTGEVRRAAQAGGLDPGVERRLLDHLARLDEEIAARGRPY